MSKEECAVCRGCGKVLKGKPYYMGGQAYDPSTGAEVKVNMYGGYVCSHECDYRAALYLEQTMPGHHGQEKLSYQDTKGLQSKWEARSKGER